jgi:hypothetical protein
MINHIFISRDSVSRPRNVAVTFDIGKDTIQISNSSTYSFCQENDRLLLAYPQASLISNKCNKLMGTQNLTQHHYESIALIYI